MHNKSNFIQYDLLLNAIYSLVYVLLEILFINFLLHIRLRKHSDFFTNLYMHTSLYA